MSETAESLEVKTPFISGKVSGSNINTILTAFCFLFSGAGCYILFAHAADAKESVSKIAQDLAAANKETALVLRETNKETALVLRETNREITAVLKDLTQATREQNCLLSLPQEKRERNVEVCKRIAR